jgi:hypothetical protein
MCKPRTCVAPALDLSDTAPVGWDISYHPIDLTFMHQRVLAFVRGERAIDDLVADAVRLAKVRFRANAWGLGVLDVSREREVPGFESDVHVWGRPFFITDKDPEAVSKAIDQYLALKPEGVDAIARGMIEKLDPALAGVVAPSKEGALPSDEDLALGIRGNLDLFRDAYAVLKKGGRTIETSDGRQFDARALFASDFPLTAVTFAVQFRPGWMARGYGWPTQLFAEIGVDTGELFVMPTDLFAPLLGEIPEIEEQLATTIQQNYSLGGYVSPKSVSRLLELLDRHSRAIDEWARSEGWGDDGAQIYLRGIREAALDAQRRGFAFVEATEIYSGPLGIMN